MSWVCIVFHGDSHPSSVHCTIPFWVGRHACWAVVTTSQECPSLPPLLGSFLLLACALLWCGLAYCMYAGAAAGLVARLTMDCRQQMLTPSAGGSCDTATLLLSMKKLPRASIDAKATLGLYAHHEFCPDIVKPNQLRRLPQHDQYIVSSSHG